MPLPLYIIDAFVTGSRFSGNPAAVCLLDGPRDGAWLQAVAAEMNLSETAFPLPDEAAGAYRLRWFTPLAEVDLCGHATLATAHVLWQTGRCPADAPIRFHTRSGLLVASPAAGGTIELDFPALPCHPCPAPEGLADALGAELVFVGNYGMDYLCEVADEAALRALRPDTARLAALRTRGVTVTARPASAEYDFVSRFFAPAVGVPEDPVTGSAHCALAPFWAARLGKAEMVGHQASRRGGLVHVRLQGDRVLLGGRAVTTVRGELDE